MIKSKSTSKRDDGKVALWVLIGTALVMLACLAAMGATGLDIHPGYAFSSGEQNVTHTKLNNLVDAATINTSFLHGQTALTPATLATDDELLVYDTSAAAYRKIPMSSLLYGNTNLIVGATADTTPAITDKVLTYSVGAGTFKQVTRANLLNYQWWTAVDLTGQSAHTAPVAADYMWIWASVGGAGVAGNRKISLTTLFYGGTEVFASSDNDLIPCEQVAGTVHGSLKISTLKSVVKAPKFTSSDVAVATGAIFNSVAHGLTSTPQYVRVVLYCQTSDATPGYVAGDEVDLASATDGSTLPWGTFGANTTTVFASCRTTSFLIPHKTTGARSAITAGNWRFRLYATYFP